MSRETYVYRGIKNKEFEGIEVVLTENHSLYARGCAAITAFADGQNILFPSMREIILERSPELENYFDADFLFAIDVETAKFDLEDVIAYYNENGSLEGIDYELLYASQLDPSTFGMASEDPNYQAMGEFVAFIDALDTAECDILYVKATI